jgi:hypothetical protein
VEELPTFYEDDEVAPVDEDDEPAATA